MGTEQAIHYLMVKKHENRFNPIFKLRLVWHFSLEKWYDDAIKDALFFPFPALTAEVLNDLEPKLAEIIVTLRDRFIRHRLDLITHVHEVKHDSSCEDAFDCAKDWRVAYSSAMLFLGQTRKFFTGREVFRKLEALAIPSMNALCRDHTLNEMESKGFLWKDEQFIQAASEAIKTTLLNERPKQNLPEPRFISDTTDYSIFRA